MNYRTLGRTGLRVSALGFGSLTIGGSTRLWGKEVGFGTTNDEESLRAIAQACDEGITLFDTAPSYGNGHAEELLGRGLRNYRDQAIICTKVGIVPHVHPPMTKDFSPDFIRTQVEESLRRLCTDYLDIVLLHRPDDEGFTDDRLWHMLSDLKRAGTIRVLGIATKGAQQAAHFIKDEKVEVLQIGYNMLEQEAAAIFPLATTYQVGLLIHSPFALGLITDRFVSGHQFAEDDYRRTKFAASLPIPLEQLQLFCFLKEAGYSLTEAALRFVLSEPAVSSCLVGMRTTSQVSENIALSVRSAFDADTYHRIRHVWEQWQHCTFPTYQH